MFSGDTLCCNALSYCNGGIELHVQGSLAFYGVYHHTSHVYACWFLAGLVCLLYLGLPVRRLAASLLRASDGIMSVCWLYLYATEVLHGNINGLMLAKGIKAHFNHMSLPNPINFRLHSTLYTDKPMDEFISDEKVAVGRQLGLSVQLKDTTVKSGCSLAWYLRGIVEIFTCLSELGGVRKTFFST